MNWKTMLLAATLAVPLTAVAQISGDAVRIGVLEEMSGLYADITGQGSVEAARMAVADFGGTVLGKRIEIVFGDHQNKADVAGSVTRKWFDVDGVDMVTGLGNSATALAVYQLGRDKQRIVMVSGAASTALTGVQCSPFGVHWTYDTYALARGTGQAVVKAGGDSWFFLTADYAFGHSLEKDVTDVVKANGGRILGSARHPLNASDFGAFLLQAQASKAKVIGLANAGGDTVNAIKAASEFGIVKGGQSLAGLLVFVNDIHALGLTVTQGLSLTEAFYWDMDDQTRAWSRRYFGTMKKMPNMLQAGVYGAVTHYLKSVKEAGTDDPTRVMQTMRKLPVNDFFTKNGSVREDGRVMRDMYLFTVKKPQESERAWDYYRLVAKIPAEQAFRPLSESACPLVKK